VASARWRSKQRWHNEISDRHKTVTSPIGKVGFAPSYADRLMALARLRELVVPEHCEVHVGANDWQCPVERLSEFGRLTGVPVTIVPDAGHMLGHGYVNALLDQWLI
jgi:hypothetical protein